VQAREERARVGERFARVAELLVNSSRCARSRMPVEHGAKSTLNPRARQGFSDSCPCLRKRLAIAGGETSAAEGVGGASASTEAVHFPFQIVRR